MSRPIHNGSQRAIDESSSARLGEISKSLRDGVAAKGRVRFHLHQRHRTGRRFGGEIKGNRDDHKIPYSTANENASVLHPG